MANGANFAQQFLEVNVNSGGALAQKRAAQANWMQHEDYAGAVLSAVDAIGSIAKTKKIADANEAKMNYLAIITSEGYRNGNAGLRAEILEEQFQANMQGRSEAYANAFSTYASSEYMKEYDNREEEIDREYYNAADAAYTAWQDEPSTTPNFSWKEGDDESNRMLTNRQAGIKPEVFTEQYSKIRPGRELDKVIIGTGILAGTFGEASLNVSMAKNQKELNAALKDNEDMMKPFKSPFFLDNKSKEGQAKIATLQSSYQNLITTKQKELTLQTKNYIEQNPYMTDTEASALIAEVSIDSATGKLDLVKFNKGVEDYQERRLNLEQHNVYEADLDTTVPTNPELLNNPEIKKKHKVNVLDSLKSSLSKDITDFIDVVSANADFLSEFKTESLGTLFSTQADATKKEHLWGRVKELSESSDGYSALKSIYGNDLQYIQGTLLLQHTLGIDRDTAIERVHKWRDNPDQDRLNKDANIALTKLNKDYGPLQDEVKQLILMSIAGGNSQDSAVAAVDDLMSKTVTEIAGVPTFMITGQPPKVSKKASEVYNSSVQAQVEEYSKINNGLPIQLEVLNNGKAIVRDATWGYKLKGYIDLKNLADTAELTAINTPESKLSKEVNRLTDATIQAGTSVVRELVEFTGNLYDSMPSPISAMKEAVYDFFRPELSAEKLKRLRANQSTTSKKKIDEEGIAPNIPNTTKPQTDIVENLEINNSYENFISTQQGRYWSPVEQDWFYFDDEGKLRSEMQGL